MSNSQKEFNKRLLEIITKFKNGKATAAEIQEIDNWYESQASNTTYTHGLSAVERSEAKHKILEEINGRIQQNSVFLTRVYPNRKLKIFAVAAAILLAVGLTFYFKITEDSVVQKKLVAVNDIAPGTNKAVLTLSNGEKINLSGLTNGEITNQTGIRISKTANGQLVYQTTGNAGVAGQKPEFNTIEVPTGGQWQVILPDHSKVWLNALSSITYPTHFTGKERSVKISGEAYFEVAHNARMPFKVTCGSQTVEVLGTHFNIMAYESDKLIKTTLLEGLVKVYTRNDTKLLVPGEQAQAGSEKILVRHDIDVEDVVSWKNGYFKFDENLEAIMAKVAKWYDVEVIYRVKPDPNIVYEGKVSRAKNISSLLKIIEFNGDVHFKIEGRRVIVME